MSKTKSYSQLSVGEKFEVNVKAYSIAKGTSFHVALAHLAQEFPQEFSEYRALIDRQLELADKIAQLNQETKEFAESLKAPRIEPQRQEKHTSTTKPIKWDNPQQAAEWLAEQREDS